MADRFEREPMYDGPRPFSVRELAELRAIAEREDKGGGRCWTWSGGYPQTVTRMGDATLIASTYQDPDTPSPPAEFIAAFDPPTVLRLLAEAVPHG